VNQGITSYPTTLVAALKWAENCVTLRKTAAGPPSMVYCAQQVALPAASRPAPKSETKGNHSATEKTKSDGTKSKNVKHSDKTKPDKTSAAGPKPKTCFFCQQTGHWGNECQLAIQAAAQYQARAGPTPGQQSVNVTASTSTVHTRCVSQQSPVKAHSQRLGNSSKRLATTWTSPTLEENLSSSLSIPAPHTSSLTTSLTRKEERFTLAHSLSFARKST